MTCRILFLCALLATITIASAQDTDPVMEKLDKAKAAYAKELEKFQKDVMATLDKREVAARKVGDKKLVDLITAERKAFEERGELPASTPRLIRQRMAMAHTTLERAYEAAIRQYTKAKNDEAAALVEKDLTTFKKDGDPTDTRRKWVHDKGTYTKQDNGMWEEKSPDGNTYRWKETARTKTYVELQSVIFDVSYTVRLTDTAADYQVGKDTTFKKKFAGKWAE